MQRIVALAVALMVPVGAAAQTEIVTYYHIDAIGSVRMVTDVAGAVVARYDYQPFGLAIDQTPPPPPERRQFAGKERDSETGFDYFGARYYTSKSGRFTTVDPVLDLQEALVNPQRWNRYTYVGNNPLRKVDPLGLWERDVHFHLTRVLAIAAGFSRHEADGIGFWTQNVDDDPATTPLGLGLWGNPVRIREMFHFVDEDRREELWRMYLSTSTLQNLGYMLHASQDQFSHAGFGSTVGHGFAGHVPDKTWVLPSRANAMARDSYTILVDAGHGRGRAQVPWNLIEPFVNRFNSSITERAKQKTLKELEDAIADYLGLSN